MFYQALCFVLQTQPVPNPLSYYLHQSPEIVHKIETMGNHVVELVVPFFVFLPRPLRLSCGVLQALFQVMDFHNYGPVSSLLNPVMLNRASSA